MSISCTNLSKNNLHSEDSISHSYINERYIVIANADGNGSLGQQSPKILHNFNNDQYKLCSIIAITTDFYINKLMNDVCSIIKLFDVDTNKIEKRINYIFTTIAKDNRQTCFSFLISILDLKDKIVYNYGLGDCTCVIYNKDNNMISYHTLQKTQRLTFNCRGAALISCPNSISNCNRDRMKLQTAINKLPQRFIFLQYSDGLDYDVAVPCYMIEDKVRRQIEWDQHFYDDPNIIRIYNKLKEGILKKDKPCPQYTKYNLSNKELLKILITHKNESSICILSHIIQYATTVDDQRKKCDDISLAVYVH